MVASGMVDAVNVAFDFYFGKDAELMQSLMGVIVTLSEIGMFVIC
jgi:hypothetical protein